MNAHNNRILVIALFACLRERKTDKRKKEDNGKFKLLATINPS